MYMINIVIQLMLIIKYINVILISCEYKPKWLLSVSFTDLEDNKKSDGWLPDTIIYNDKKGLLLNDL